MCRRRHQGQRALEGASMDLGLAVASMGAARHLALRGGAPCPSAPLDSVDDLAGDDPGVWCALEKLGNAAALATRVHDGVERARGHLRAAELLGFLDEASDGGGDGLRRRQHRAVGAKPVLLHVDANVGVQRRHPLRWVQPDQVGGGPKCGSGTPDVQNKFSLPSTG